MVAHISKKLNPENHFLLKNVCFSLNSEKKASVKENHTSTFISLLQHWSALDCVSSDNRDPCLSLFLKDIGCACAAVWPVSPHHWSRPSGSGGQWSRFWLLLRWMSPGRGTPCGFHGTLWNSRQGRSCHLHADGRCLIDRPLSLYTANQWWLMKRRSGSKKWRERRPVWLSVKQPKNEANLIGAAFSLVKHPMNRPKPSMVLVLLLSLQSDVVYSPEL